MSKFINTIVIGCGQAGLAASEHLKNNNIQHIIFERDRIVILIQIHLFQKIV
jgi:putative flavoprotein involved in K+ transport